VSIHNLVVSIQRSPRMPQDVPKGDADGSSGQGCRRHVAGGLVCPLPHATGFAIVVHSRVGSRIPWIERRRSHGTPKRDKGRGIAPRGLHLTTNRRTTVADTKAETKKKRKPANPSSGKKTIKASLIVDAETHRKWGVAASIEGRKREEIALEALKKAVSWVVIQDHRKTEGPVASDDRLDLGADVSSLALAVA
jgi:hypothetical protein